MNIAVVGGNGQLGRDVVTGFEQNGDAVRALTHEDIELSDRESVFNAVRKFEPQMIVNTAAMHHVEKCEADAERAFAVNGIGVRNLALAAREIGASLVHISTDYVFDGSKQAPYLEQDTPRPLNVYGTSKLAGEYFVRSATDRYFVLRTSAIYGSGPCRAKGGLNFVELMLKLAKDRPSVRVVDHEFVSPTPTVDIAKQIVQLSRSDAYGLYHATAEGSCSWYAFAREIFDLTNTTANLEIAGPNEFPMKVPRPTYSVLENAGLKAGERGQIHVNSHYQTEVPHIYAAGDVIGFPSLASSSSEQGRLASNHMFGVNSRQISANLLPYGIYTVPEMSMIGRTEQQLTAAKVPYEVGIAKYEELAKGQILGDETGLLKMLFDPEKLTLYGVHAIGDGAAELIHIAQAVLAFGGTIEYFRDTVFNYPTLAEAYKVAALAGLNRL